VWLRKKGIAGADKKASRIAAEGAVVQYIHAGARLGVLVEVNCETDFVARGDKFKELANDIAMQVAACTEIEYVSPSDADQAMIEKEREVQMKMEDLQSKPENIREKIVQGRLDKMVNEKALLTQPFIKDTSKTVDELIKEATAEIGEKISIRRFTKYNLGEGLEKRVEDFAAEVAAQTGGKA
jgi:elongation factor Ts